MQYSFHGFDIFEKIGSGGMSTVYRGVHQTLGYSVAVKILHPGLAGDTNFIRRFEREAKAASALRCNNIASVIDFGSEDDVYFIVMEFIDGHDLAKIFEKIQNSTDKAGAFPIEIALLLIEEVAYGLKEAHKHGLIHRDIKPANILIDQRGEVKIADFGLARDTSELSRPNTLDLTTPGTVLGTPSYMSPEQAAGKPDLDNRTDIFSLGVMAYQLLTGQKPFSGDTPTAVQEKIINDDPVPLTEENCPLLTAEVEVMMGKMLAKDPQKRYSTIDRLLRGLKESMESIDSSGNLNRYRRDYLSNFATDPVGFSEELRSKSISSHLKLGYHFKNQGFANIDDAIREFTYVLSVDPDNEKAAEALQELKRRQMEQTEQGATGDDVTRVMPGAAMDPNETVIMPGGVSAVVPPQTEVVSRPPTGTDRKPPPPPESKPGGGTSRRSLFIGVGVVLMAAVLVVLYILGRPGGEQTGFVDLRSEPTGSEVWLRQGNTGEFRNSGQVTDCLVPELESGSWEIQLRQEGYEVAFRTGEITADDTLSLVVPLIRLVARGGLIVETVPPGATVSYRRSNTGGTFMAVPGATPLEVADLEVGRYDLNLELDGHTPLTEQIEISADTLVTGRYELAAVEVTPASSQGRIKITSQPAGARVQMSKRGGQQYETVGVTPFTSDLLDEGRWDIRIALDGHEPTSLQGRVQAGTTRNYDVPLRELPPAVKADGYVQLIISPFGDVYVDGRQVASEAKRLDLQLSPDQSHRIEIRHIPTFSSLVLEDINVALGDTLRLPRQVFLWGALAVSSNAECEITIDDQSKGQLRRWQLPQIGVGKHIVSVHRTGFKIESVTLLDGERRELTPIDATQTPPRYIIDIGLNADVKLHFRLSQVD